MSESPSQEPRAASFQRPHRDPCTTAPSSLPPLSVLLPRALALRSVSRQERRWRGRGALIEQVPHVPSQTACQVGEGKRPLSLTVFGAQHFPCRGSKRFLPGLPLPTPPPEQEGRRRCGRKRGKKKKPGEECESKEGLGFRACILLPHHHPPREGGGISGFPRERRSSSGSVALLTGGD